MADLAFAPQHNMIAYLEKIESNAEFHQIVDFLTSSSIHHSLTPRLENDPRKLGAAPNLLRSKQPFILEESPIDTMADQRTMAELLCAPTEGYAEAIVVLPILADHFELKHLINMMTTDQFFVLEKNNPHDLICWWQSVRKTYSRCVNDYRKNLRDVTIVMTAILKQFQATPPPASVKAVEETCVTCGGAHPYYQCLVSGGNTFLELQDNIQGYGSAAAVNYNQGNSVYRPLAPTQQNQIVPLNELEIVKRMNEANMKAMQTQINMVKNNLRNEMKNSIQVSLSNQTNEIKNMMASLFQMNTASTSGLGSLPSNTEVDERVEEILMDPDLSEYTIKVPPPPVQKYKP
nr:hypothetical protein [Tanacetum cinerariifolium]